MLILTTLSLCPFVVYVFIGVIGIRTFEFKVIETNFPLIVMALSSCSLYALEINSVRFVVLC